MKIVLVTPNFHQPRGNTVTVQRIADGLKTFGITTEIVSVTEEGAANVLPAADLIHGFHAYRFYKFLEKLEHKVESYIVTITGTDLYQDLFNDEKRLDVVRSLAGAAAIHVFDKRAKQLLEKEIPSVANRVHIIPQANSFFPKTKINFEKETGTFLFVLPAGIRKVKNIPFAINSLKKLYTQNDRVRLWIVGPVIEEDEGLAVKELLEENKNWAKYMGAVPHSMMGAVLLEADVVLNTSHSEGQSTAILEAMGFGIPVLVSSNDGNRSIVSHERTGFVYNEESDFLVYAEKLINNSDGRKEIGQAAIRYVNENHNRHSEAVALKRIYENVLSEKGGHNMSEREIIKLTSLSSKGG
ncbi:Glycosyltransferase involved in cell wall bisynthesis [Bacillus sp. cl95]|nr:Glycosyltransferase involved in cell wall bisynthesis [Bacillus sp. UNCCL13]SFQ89830.1 Glycosyltransferase involved in cell wall bisynthesis [Bacillus sp. cl95]